MTDSLLICTCIWKVTTCAYRRCSTISRGYLCLPTDVEIGSPIKIIAWLILLFVCLSTVGLSVCLSGWLAVCCLPVCLLSACLSVCLFVYFFVCLFVILCFFVCLYLVLKRKLTKVEFSSLNTAAISWLSIANAKRPDGGNN